MTIQEIKNAYAVLLKEYVESQKERYLVEAAALGRALVEARVPTEDLAEIHEQALRRLASGFTDTTLLEPAARASAPLTEMLMAYGLAFREWLDDRERAMIKLEALVEERTAELLVAKEKAEAADRVKSIFLATMSHELRTPLNSIMGFTGILLKGLAGPLNDEQRKQLGWVRESGRDLLSLISDVLDISKIEAGQLELIDSSFDIREPIEKVVGALSPLAAENGLALVVEATAEAWPVIADRRRVEQILTNLVGNAIKFTDRGTVRIVCHSHASDMETQVLDTGIGIRPEDMAALFEPFQQVGPGKMQLKEGTGLGLNICKRLVELMGGQVRAESEYGVGSTFSFTLPVKGGTQDETQDPDH